MGCCFQKQDSDSVLLENVYNAQSDLLELSGIPLKDFQLKNV